MYHNGVLITFKETLEEQLNKVEEIFLTNAIGIWSISSYVKDIYRVCQYYTKKNMGLGRIF
jgi:hypothetical protein